DVMTTRSLADDISDELPSLTVDADTKAAIEKWLKADKDFNVWFLVTTKRSLGDDDLLGLLDGYRETQEAAETAWRAFRKEELDAASLRAGLYDSIARMDALMNK